MYLGDRKRSPRAEGTTRLDNRLQYLLSTFTSTDPGTSGRLQEAIEIAHELARRAAQVTA